MALPRDGQDHCRQLGLRQGRQGNGWVIKTLMRD